MRRFLYAAVVVVVVAGFAVAEEYNVIVTEVDVRDGHVTFYRGPVGKGAAMNQVKVQVAEKVAVHQATVTFDKQNKKTSYQEGDAITDGLKNDLFSANNLREQPVRARVTVEGEGDQARLTKSSSSS